MIPLGDLTIVNGETPPPAKLIKALAVVAEYLHPLLSKRPTIASPDKSKESCVLASATVREFLFRIGFRDVEVAPCFAAIRAQRDGAVLHTLGIGDPEFKKNAADKKRRGYWNGHMVVRVPSAGYMIDTTLYPARRPAWPELPGMMAAPTVNPKDPEVPEAFGMKAIAGALIGPQEDGKTIDLLWLDQPANRAWRFGPDYQDRGWRVAVAERMVELFGEWHE